MWISTEHSTLLKLRQGFQVPGFWKCGIHSFHQRNSGEYSSTTGCCKFYLFLRRALFGCTPNVRWTQANHVLCKLLQYNASKAGVLQLAKSLVVEWVDFCRVNCVSPGYIQTQTMEYVSQEMLDKWRNQIQARRFASPYKLKGVGVQQYPRVITIL